MMLVVSDKFSIFNSVAQINVQEWPVNLTTSDVYSAIDNRFLITQTTAE